MKKITIFLADDHQILREGLKLILSKNENLQVIGESADGRDALEKIEKLNPDIAILDISLPSMLGIEIAHSLKKYQPGIKIIILTQHSNSEYIQEAIRLGVEGYILKNNASEELIKAIEKVIEGNNYISPEVTTQIFSDFRKNQKNTTTAPSDTYLDSQFSRLTPREREILKLIAEGKKNKEIASLLFISDQTVKVHRSNIMKKLHFNNLSELIKYAIANRLID